MVIRRMTQERNEATNSRFVFLCTVNYAIWLCKLPWMVIKALENKGAQQRVFFAFVLDICWFICGSNTTEKIRGSSTDCKTPVFWQFWNWKIFRYENYKNTRKKNAVGQPIVIYADNAFYLSHNQDWEFFYWECIKHWKYIPCRWTVKQCC